MAKCKPTLYIYYNSLANELWQLSYKRLLDLINNEKMLNLCRVLQTPCLDFFNFKYLEHFKDIILLDFTSSAFIEYNGFYSFLGTGHYISLQELYDFDKHYYQYELPYTEDLQKFIKNEQFKWKDITHEFLAELPLCVFLSNDNLNKIKHLKYEPDTLLKNAGKLKSTI